METKEFTITIDAPREKVWDTLWNDTTYREWTSVFAEGSWAQTDWKKGSKVLFLDGKNMGMVSVIAENRPYEYMSFKHLGSVVDGVEDLESAQVKEWAGATENYTLQTVDGKTKLTVDMSLKGISENMQNYFFNTWPQALAKLKALAEKN